MAGAGDWEWYEKACAKAMQSLGHVVKLFSWTERFRIHLPSKPEPVYKSLWAGIQNKFIFGPQIIALNKELLQEVSSFKPDALFIYNGTHILKRTLCKIKKQRPNTILVQYSNDNPLSQNASYLLWRHLIRSISYYDLHFVYRHQNLVDFKEAGAKVVKLLRSYYIPDKDYRVELTPEDSRFQSDVVFAGHYEDDFRVEYLEEICKLGIKLNLFGGGWQRALKKIDAFSPLRKFYPIEPVVGEDYRKALSGAKIALCFLSKLNEDTYTRRNFEIPATKTFMLSEYTEDLASLFEEGHEAEFFRTKSELIEKVKYYLKHDSERKAIAQRGYERLVKDGHDILSRMEYAVYHIEQFMNK